MLMAPVQSVFRLPNSFPMGKNPWQDIAYKWNLLKVREEKFKGKHFGPGRSQSSECFCSSDVFKTHNILSLM
jgi:hypothetical protein